MENKYTYRDNILKVLERRSSCRCYTGEQITDEQLEILLKAGNAAPVAMNRINDIKIYVIQNPCLLEKLEITTQRLFSQIDYHIKALYGAPTLIIVAVRKLKAEQVSEAIVTSALQKSLRFSGACVVENMIIVATEMALGNIVLSGVTNALNQDTDLLREIGIEEDFEAIGSIAVGKTQLEVKTRDLSKMKFEIAYKR